MIIKKQDIINAGELTLEEDILLSNDEISSHPDIIKVNKVTANVKAKMVSGLVIVNLRVVGDLVLRSTRTLKPVEYKVKEKEELTYTFEKGDYDDIEDIIKLDTESIDLHNEIVSLVITGIPLKIIASDDPEHLEGDKWELISEDEYYKKKAENIDPRLEKLKNFDLD